MRKLAIKAATLTFTSIEFFLGLPLDEFFEVLDDIAKANKK